MIKALKILGIVVGSFLLLLIIVGLLPKSEIPSAPSTSAQKTNVTTPAPKLDITAELKKLVADLGKYKYSTSDEPYRNLRKWNETIVTLDAHRDTVTGENAKLLSEAEKLQKGIQKKHFKDARQNCADVLATSLWRENIEVQIKGKNKDVIHFINGIFANNANIEDFQNEVRNTLQYYRFKRIQYSWYDGADITYYDMSPEGDEVLLRIPV